MRWQSAHHLTDHDALHNISAFLYLPSCADQVFNSKQRPLKVSQKNEETVLQFIPNTLTLTTALLL